MASTPLGVAVIGLGRWGPYLFRNLMESESCRVRVVCDADEKALAPFRARFPDLVFASDYRRALKSRDVDAVFIVTPAATHFAIVSEALKAGKHVFVEKPLTTNHSQAKALARLAKQKKRKLMVGHVFVYNQAIRAIEQELQQGTLGRLYHIDMVRTNLGPIRADVNALWDLASHDVSILLYWLKDLPVKALGKGGVYINRGVEDVVFATLTFPSGVLANLHASWLSPMKVRQITLVGEKRMLTWDDISPSEPLRLYDKGVQEKDLENAFGSYTAFRQAVREGNTLIPKISVEEPLKRECRHFLECLQNNNDPETDGVFSARVVRVLEAVQKSMRTGRETPV